MSSEFSATKLEVRDDAGNLIVDHATKLIPVVQKLTLTNIDVAFPDVSKGTGSVNGSGGRTGTRVINGTNRGYRIYAWGLIINEGIQQGSINLASITPGVSPNLVLGNIRCSRIVNPREDIFGPIIKSVLENTWLPIRSGARLEYGAWLRRIVWFDIAAGFVRLNWKQSTSGYAPIANDPNIVFFPDVYESIERPPGYKLGSRYYWNNGGITDPPINFPPDPMPSNQWPQPPGAITFASTWRFSNINLWLMQV